MTRNDLGTRAKESRSRLQSIRRQLLDELTRLSSMSSMVEQTQADATDDLSHRKHRHFDTVKANVLMQGKLTQVFVANR